MKMKPFRSRAGFYLVALAIAAIAVSFAANDALAGLPLPPAPPLPKGLPAPPGLPLPPGVSFHGGSGAYVKGSSGKQGKTNKNGHAYGHGKHRKRH